MTSLTFVTVRVPQNVFKSFNETKEQIDDFNNNFMWDPSAFPPIAGSTSLQMEDQIENLKDCTTDRMTAKSYFFARIYVPLRVTTNQNKTIRNEAILLCLLLLPPETFLCQDDQTTLTTTLKDSLIINYGAKVPCHMLIH
jgi:hypothetical protein